MEHQGMEVEAPPQGGPGFYPPLYLQRYKEVSNIVTTELARAGITRGKLVDFGSAEGTFLRFTKNIPTLDTIACVDIDLYVLKSEKLYFEAAPRAWDYITGRFNPLQVHIYHGSIAVTDVRVKAFDVVTAVELIEHLNPDVLEKVPDVIFGYIQPRLVILTTPNAEFNIHFSQLPAGKFRHYDHKFEWTRAEFNEWCCQVVQKYPDYEFQLDGVGRLANSSDGHVSIDTAAPDVGCASQIAVFRRKSCPVDPMDAISERFLTSNMTERDSNVSTSTPYTLLNTYTFPQWDKTQEEANAKSEEVFDWS